MFVRVDDAAATQAREIEECSSDRTGTWCSYRVEVSSAPGEQSSVVIEFRPDEIFISDTSAPLHAGEGCDALGDGRVACPRESLEITLGDADDSLSVVDTPCEPGDDLNGYDNQCPSVRANGGDGADILSGGRGNDVLNGGAGPDELHGGPGGDHLLDGDAAPALSSDLLDGGDDLDQASYRDREDPITIDFQTATAGAPGEADRLVSIEDATGGRADDRLFGDGGEINTLDGYAGDDMLRGRGGSDTLIGNIGYDRLFGGSGDDNLWGGALPGRRFESYPVPAGVDEADRIACGRGADTSRALLPEDKLLIGCENAVPAGYFDHASGEPTFALADEVATPAAPIARLVGAYCDSREPCPALFRVVLRRRVGSARRGTTVARRRLALAPGANPRLSLRLNRLGRSLIAEHGQLPLRMLNRGWGQSSFSEDRRPIGFGFAARLSRTE